MYCNPIKIQLLNDTHLCVLPCLPDYTPVGAGIFDAGSINVTWGKSGSEMKAISDVSIDGDYIVIPISKDMPLGVYDVHITGRISGRNVSDNRRELIEIVKYGNGIAYERYFSKMIIIGLPDSELQRIKAEYEAKIAELEAKIAEYDQRIDVLDNIAKEDGGRLENLATTAARKSDIPTDYARRSDIPTDYAKVGDKAKTLDDIKVEIPEDLAKNDVQLAILSKMHPVCYGDLEIKSRLEAYITNAEKNFLYDFAGVVNWDLYIIKWICPYLEDYDSAGLHSVVYTSVGESDVYDNSEMSGTPIGSVSKYIDDRIATKADTDAIGGKLSGLAQEETLQNTHKVIHRYLHRDTRHDSDYNYYATAILISKSDIYWFEYVGDVKIGGRIYSQWHCDNIAPINVYTSIGEISKNQDVFVLNGETLEKAYTVTNIRKESLAYKSDLDGLAKAGEKAKTLDDINVDNVTMAILSKIEDGDVYTFANRIRFSNSYGQEIYYDFAGLERAKIDNVAYKGDGIVACWIRTPNIVSGSSEKMYSIAGRGWGKEKHNDTWNGIPVKRLWSDPSLSQGYSEVKSPDDWQNVYLSTKEDVKKILEAIAEGGGGGGGDSKYSKWTAEQLGYDGTPTEYEVISQEEVDGMINEAWSTTFGKADPQVPGSKDFQYICELTDALLYGDIQQSAQEAVEELMERLRSPLPA